jgi:CheY-like chemotaxis protein
MALSLGPGRTSVSTTILFVDGDASLLKARRLVFEALGYRVLTADSGERALELLQVNAVDAVILDHLLPGMDGGETARRIHTARGNIVSILCPGGFSVPQHVLEAVSASVSKWKGPVALLELLEQQLRIVPWSRMQRKAIRPYSLVVN